MPRQCVSHKLHKPTTATAVISNNNNNNNQKSTTHSSIARIVEPSSIYLDRYKEQVNTWKASGIIPHEYEEDSSVLEHWSTTTLEIPVVFHVYAPISGISDSNTDGFLKHLEFLIDRTNKDFNAESSEFDNVDFDSHNLFSMNKNPSSFKENRDTYLRMITRARAANIRFVLDRQHCTYKPQWNGFSSMTSVDRKIASDASCETFRSVIDKYVKYTSNKSDAWNPESTCNIWIVKFLDDSLAGYSTFPTDVESGSSNDGLVLSINVCQPLSSMMDPQVNLWKTISHELGHYCGCFHTFDPNDMWTQDTPVQNIEFGDQYLDFTWPKAQDGTPYDINNIMGYQSDSNSFIFSRDQVIYMRNALMSHRSKICKEVATTSGTDFNVIPYSSNFRNIGKFNIVNNNNNKEIIMTSVAAAASSSSSYDISKNKIMSIMNRFCCY